jgi:hypothetical protein
MHVKLTNGQPSQFPYSVGQFRRDNPQTSFPKVIPDEMLKRHFVHPVIELSKPTFDPLVQTLNRDELPHKEVIRLKTEEDATDPTTGEVDQAQVGQPIYGNRWFIGYTVDNKPQDQAEDAVRSRRNRLLSDTDWMALSDNTMSPAWASYRQALRDITAQEGFPYSVVWPTKPE